MTMENNIQQKKSPFKAHLFICTNEKSCGKKNAESLRLKLKDSCQGLFGKDVRVNKAGCLGDCEHGIAAVLYPSGQCYSDLSESHHDFLVNEVKNSLTN